MTYSISSTSGYYGTTGSFYGATGSIDPNKIKKMGLLYHGESDDNFINGYYYFYDDIFEVHSTYMRDKVEKRFDGSISKIFGKQTEVNIKNKWYKEADFTFDIPKSIDDLKNQERDKKINSILV